MRAMILFVLIFLGIAHSSPVQVDSIKTARGDLLLHFISHGTLMFQWDGLVIHIDPVSRYGDYDKMPKADLILVTHGHGDHLDWQAIGKVQKPSTVIIGSPVCADESKKLILLKNGDTTTVLGIKIEAVPAYNIVHLREGKAPFHPKGEGNGYVLTLADKRIYVAGDSENVPEMKNLNHIDAAFLPMNLPYTMTPEMVADAARMFRPKILYPYHYGQTDPALLQKLLASEKDICVRIRDLR